MELEQEVTSQEMALQQEYSQRIVALRHNWSHQKTMLEQQALQLSIEYQHKSAQEDMMQKQHLLQREQYESQQKLSQEMQKLQSSSSFSANPLTVPPMGTNSFVPPAIGSPMARGGPSPYIGPPQQQMLMMGGNNGSYSPSPVPGMPPGSHQRITVLPPVYTGAHGGSYTPAPVNAAPSGMPSSSTGSYQPSILGFGAYPSRGVTATLSRGPPPQHVGQGQGSVMTDGGQGSHIDPLPSNVYRDQQRDAGSNIPVEAMPTVMQASYPPAEEAYPASDMNSGAYR